jgi:hypothetical protein
MFLQGGTKLALPARVAPAQRLVWQVKLVQFQVQGASSRDEMRLRKGCTGGHLVSRGGWLNFGSNYLIRKGFSGTRFSPAPGLNFDCISMI